MNNRIWYLSLWKIFYYETTTNEIAISDKLNVLQRILKDFPKFFRPGVLFEKIKTQSIWNPHWTPKSSEYQVPSQLHARGNVRLKGLEIAIVYSGPLCD